MTEQHLSGDVARGQILKNLEHEQKVNSAFEKAREILPTLNEFDEQLQIRMRPDIEDHVGGGKLHGYIEQAFIQHITKLGIENRFFTSEFIIRYRQSVTHDKTIVNIHFKRLGNVKKIPNSQALYSKWNVVVSDTSTNVVYCEATFNLIGPDPKYIRPNDTQIEFNFNNQ